MRAFNNIVKRLLTRTIVGSVLSIHAAPLYADLQTKPNPQVDYSWVKHTHFTNDQTDLFNVDHELLLRPNSPFRANSTLNSFLEGINKVENQTAIKQVYGINTSTYFILARLAVGIMYAESKFGSHPKYFIKERFPWSVASLKSFLNRSKLDPQTYLDTWDAMTLGLKMEYEGIIKDEYDPMLVAPELFDLSENSRGPTQIKYLPPLFEKYFPGIDKNNLHIPQNSAVATMAYLANATVTLAKVAQKYGCEIPKSQFLYHLLYIYVGRAAEIIHCTATLDRNQYWRRALEIQDNLFVANYKQTRIQLTSNNRSFEAKKLVALQQELTSRTKIYVLLTRQLDEAEAKRLERLRLPPELLNEMLEYMLAAGLVSSTHVLLKNRLPSREAWASRPTCTKLLLGRKRYFALLHGVNSVIVTKMLMNRELVLGEVFEVDLEKKQFDLLREALRAEATIIKRLRLDIDILRSTSQMN